jgi:RNA polymerase sigma factor (sigma-70 family)
MKLLSSLPQTRYTQEEEFSLAARIQKTPSEDLLNDLVLHNMEEAFLYMKGVCRAKMPDDEIFSLCYKTLLRNAKRFRPGGIRFLAFAKAGIRGAISRFWTGLNTVKNADSVSLDQPNFKSSGLDDDNPGNWDWDHIPEPTVDPEFAIIDIRERMGLITEIMSAKLSEQEKMIMNLVYKSGFNFQQVGNLLGITRSAAQANHSEILKKVRRELTRRGLLQK